jgi:hypothetical protein
LEQPVASVSAAARTTALIPSFYAAGANQAVAHCRPLGSLRGRFDED